MLKVEIKPYKFCFSAAYDLQKVVKDFCLFTGQSLAEEKGRITAEMSGLLQEVSEFKYKRVLPQIQRQSHILVLLNIPFHRDVELIHYF